MLQTPKISILIATDDHPLEVSTFLSSIVDQTLAPTDYEVVIVDPTRIYDYGPEWEQMCRRKPAELRVTFATIDRPGRAAALNHALALTSAPLIAIFPDDAMFPPSTFESHLRFHQQNPELEVVGIAAMLLPERYRRDDFARWLERSGELFGVPVSEDVGADDFPDAFFYGANVSIKREFLIRAGSFNEAFPYFSHDDAEVGRRLAELGMKTRFVPNANTVHLHDISLQERAERMALAGESARIYERLHPGIQPWQKYAQCSPRRHLRRAEWLDSLYQLTGIKYFREAYYRAQLNASFAAGYQGVSPALAE